MRIRAKVDREEFSRRVFGGDYFVLVFPDLFTEVGVEVKFDGEFYRIIRSGVSRLQSMDEFFSQEEFDTCLQLCDNKKDS